MLRHSDLLLQVCRREQPPAELLQEPAESAAQEERIEGVVLAAWPASLVELP
jgi:hypothetical protein